MVAQTCDLASEIDIAALTQTAIERFGRLDVAVNAGAMPLGGTVANTPPEDAMRSMEVNYLGSVHFVQHMAAAMETGGSIILLSSLASTHVMEHVYSYACAKAAVDCLVRYAALEYTYGNEEDHGRRSDSG
ncbi:SDR family oxidoreductase [Rhizorhapis suberifaciens]|uniref:NAD(P)-dependent dehydrogenase (Short-subunit alcohol dehydrogenase family) n=1 Tax=Rhizorhapis suberifaciens TaxID=13656 RepID=A0A840HVI3_9SPHN|nr:SDR family oxidoreductase [Rhizorhapis suberifaciens]MBB4641434.1 NAD(P)-dependent dehydrogenase (short-subunit alcohol dehydrogenase family) [Rhizorhapis suberifaciens]